MNLTRRIEKLETKVTTPPRPTAILLTISMDEWTEAELDIRGQELAEQYPDETAMVAALSEEELDCLMALPRAEHDQEFERLMTAWRAEQGKSATWDWEVGQ